MKGKKYLYAHKFEGIPKVTDLQLVEEELPPVNDGGIESFLSRLWDLKMCDLKKTVTFYSFLGYPNRLNYLMIA